MRSPRGSGADIRQFRSNPAGVEPGFLAALQTAFPGWGGRDRFDWWFRRAAGGPAADLLVLADGDVLVAGLAVVYRRVRVPAGPPELAGVLAAAWTEPGSRRTGCFSELVERAREAAHARGASILLGFSLARRESRGRLAAAATACFDTWYLRIAANGAARPAAAAAPDVGQLHAWFRDRPGGARVVYPTPEIFAEQARLDVSTVAACGAGTWAIVEPQGESLQVHAIVAEPPGPDPEALAAAFVTAAGATSALAYTTEKDVAEQAVRRGAEASPGFLFALPPQDRLPGHWTAAEWRLQALDRA